MNKQDTPPQKSALIAHEIRQPLSAISMLAGLSLDEIKEPETPEREHMVRKYLEEIIKQSKQCSQIVEDIRTSKSDIRRSIEVIELNAIIDQALSDIQYTDEGKGITIHKQLQQDMPSIRGSRLALTQLFVNLFSNAAAAMQNSTTKILAVRTTRSQQNLLIEIRDTGNGIHADDLARIFEPYHTTKGENNMGLGLAICKTIVENHKGTIRAAEDIENGACVQVYLPVKQP